jgi:hypothetical protein
VGNYAGLRVCVFDAGDRILSVKTSILQVEGQRVQVTLDYIIDVSEAGYAYLTRRTTLCVLHVKVK